MMIRSALPPSHRLIALALLAGCLACLRLQHDALQSIAGDLRLWQVIWLQLGYLQPLSMLGLAGLMLAITQSRNVAPWLMLSAIFATFCGAWLGLPLTQAQLGDSFWPATLLRWLIAPVALIWWLRLQEPLPPPRALPKFAVWPLAYLLYMLMRGALQGLWPAADLQDITDPKAALLPFGGAMLAYGLLTALTAVLAKARRD